ncbi:hypothetical protein FNV43_RR11732 [Rhamnella rubrinervis]|uniref:F-box domain-containing protein n=1 Tax=Rhamnella rubrinervis TaxID=2594499 RepID=A0A8K0H624_9ROSA|nr:hypothetical protein FNV43_RR11732 [Rhamnella rubrinervis]
MKERRHGTHSLRSPVKTVGQPLITTLPPVVMSSKMDPGIWSRLPEELLEHVLSFLPLKSLLNLRSTCKHFSSLIFSPPFVSKHSSSSPFSSFLLLSHPQCYHHFPLYDSSLGNWRNLTLSVSALLPSAAAPASLLSASNGLLCFSLPSSTSFLVCNLLVKSSRVIQFPSYPFSFELLSLFSTPVGYNIFMLSSGSSSSSAFVYDSKFHTWRQFDGFDPIITDNYHQEGVYFDGSLYFVTPEPFSVVCLDLESGKWQRSNAELPSELTFVRLVSDGEGKLYLISGIGSNGISRSMKLWELVEGRKWVEVERAPEMMCRKFMSSFEKDLALAAQMSFSAGQMELWL